MSVLYLVGKCPRCGEDDLIIALNKQTNGLYLNCGECEASWHHPDDVEDPQKMFIDLTIDAADPTTDDINAAGWDRFVIGRCERS